MPKASDGQQNTENQKALPDVVGSKKQVSYRTEIIGGVPIVTPTQVTPSAVLCIYNNTWNHSYHYNKPVVWCMISDVKLHWAVRSCCLSLSTKAAIVWIEPTVKLCSAPTASCHISWAVQLRITLSSSQATASNRELWWVPVPAACWAPCIHLMWGKTYSILLRLLVFFCKIVYPVAAGFYPSSSLFRWGTGRGDISCWKKTRWVTSNQIW